MEIIFYHPTFNAAWWVNALEKALPHARVREWKVGDNNPADYALVWQPPVEMLAGRRLKAVFALGAGVDAMWGGNYFCTDRRCYKLIVKSTTTRPMGDLGILHCAEKNDLKMIFLP